MHDSARWHRRGGALSAGHRQPGGHRQRGRDRDLGLRCARTVADEVRDELGPAGGPYLAGQLPRGQRDSADLVGKQQPELGRLAAEHIAGQPDADVVARSLLVGGGNLDDPGASGFLLKDATAAELVHPVRVVAAGDALLAPSVTRRLIADFASRPPQDPPVPGTLDTLTHREAEVLRLIARGLSNAEISDALVIAEQTTKTHVGRILAKLRLRDRAQAVVLAYETGLVTPGGYSTEE
jgi:DNA-binding CsgD family transcriptional regulator